MCAFVPLAGVKDYSVHWTQCNFPIHRFWIRGEYCVADYVTRSISIVSKLRGTVSMKAAAMNSPLPQ